jgi:Skp family chaperone for outer membrane proteins
VALLGALLAGRLAAQPGRPAAVAEPKTKVALINLTYVIKNYKKFTTFQDEIKSSVSPFQVNDTKYKQEGEKLAKELQQPTTKDERREQIEKRIVVLKRLIDDNKVEANKTLTKKQEEQLKILYMDVRQVVERVAQSRGFEMVLHFNDAVEPRDYWNPQNIARKMQAGALMPMYYTGALDISNDVVQTLNSSYKAPAPVAARPTR